MNVRLLPFDYKVIIRVVKNEADKNFISQLMQFNVHENFKNVLDVQARGFYSIFSWLIS